MTDALFDSMRIIVAIALLLTVAVGLGWISWVGLNYLGRFGRPRPRLVQTQTRLRPGREPTRPRSDLAWRHGRNDLQDRDSEPRDD
jgi:hypothetical protein